MNGILLMVVAAIGFAIMNSIAKLVAGHGVPSTEVAFARSLVGLPMLYLAARAKGHSFSIRNKQAMLVRALAGSTALVCTFHALAVLPLGEATALQNTTPLFVAVLGWLFLKEKPRLLVVVMLVLGFAGVVLILRPASDDVWNGSIALAAGAFSAIAMVSLRQLGATEKPEVVVFWFTTTALVVTGMIAVTDIVIPSWEDVGWMIAMGLIATWAQVLMTRAYALDIAARVGGGAYVNVVVSALIGAVFFAEPLLPVSMTGIAIVIVAGVVIALDAQRDVKRAKAALAERDRRDDANQPDSE